MASLAAADLLSCGGILLSPIYDYAHFENSINSRKVICILKETLNLIYMAGNVITILWIAVDRFLYCSYPTKYTRLVTMGRYKMLLVAMWTYIVAMVTLSFSVVNTYRPGVLCVFTNIELLPYPVFLVVHFSQFMLYSLITVILYCLIGRLAFKKARQSKMAARTAVVPQRSPNPTEGSTETESVRREQKITSTLATILGLYFGFYLPGLVLGTLVRVDSPTPLVVVYLTSILWFHVNSCINPFVYAHGFKDVRRALKLMVKQAKGFKSCCGSGNSVGVAELS